MLKTVTTPGPVLLHSLRDHLLNSRDNFGARHRSHATEIERAFPQKTGTALDMMPKNPMPLSQWRARLSFGTEARSTSTFTRCHHWLRLRCVWGRWSAHRLRPFRCTPATWPPAALSSFGFAPLDRTGHGRVPASLSVRACWPFSMSPATPSVTALRAACTPS